MKGQVTMRDRWRWTLRGLAVALVVGGVLLALRPIPSTTSRDTFFGYPEVVTIACLSPFAHVQGKVVGATASPTPVIAGAGPDTYLLKCKSAASDREHIIEALGAAAVILVGLSFVPRRRPVVTIPVNPSVL